MHLTAACFGSYAASNGTTAAAWRFEGGPAPGLDNLNLDACSTGAQGALGISLVIPGGNKVAKYMGGGGLLLTDQNGTSWGVDGDGWQADVTTFGDTGAYVDGTFNGMVTHGGNAAHTIQAQFHLCHIADILAP